jgi:hypothetical protein
MMVREDICISNDFLNRIPTAQEMIRTEKWDCIKLKGFCTAKETIECRDSLQTERKSLPAMQLIRIRIWNI